MLFQSYRKKLYVKWLKSCDVLMWVFAGQHHSKGFLVALPGAQSSNGQWPQASGIWDALRLARFTQTWTPDVAKIWAPRLILNLYFDSSVALWQNVHLGSRSIESIECQRRIERSIQKLVFVSQKSSSWCCIDSLWVWCGRYKDAQLSRDGPDCKAVHDARW